MTLEPFWDDTLALDVNFGYLTRTTSSPRRHHPQMVLNGDAESVLRTLRQELRTSRSFCFSVAFVSPRAVALLKQELVEFTGSGLIVTSDYLGFNSPTAFAELLNLRTVGIDVRVHRAAAFHPKGYVFQHEDTVTAMVGSSNLTANALVKNHEWNLKVSAGRDSDLARQLQMLVERQQADSEPLSQSWIDDYALRYLTPAPPPGRPVPAHQGADQPAPVTANAMQQDALLALDLVRAEGERRALIISATGTGKTLLSALDVRAVDPERLLFVVHREQILDRTIREYHRVLGGSLTEDYGKLTGSAKQSDRRYVFATVQTLSQPDTLASLDRDAFDYVVIDEAHRAGAAGHRRVLDHFEPDFMLGMTATPERTDGFDVFELFDHNVPYEIRLNHALETDMLSPFHYYGVADVEVTQGESITSQSDLSVLISRDRVDHLLRTIEIYGQAGVAPRGLIFCSRREEAHLLSQALNQMELRGRRLRTVALTQEDSVPRREAQVAALEDGDLDYILTVDLFNEGVDIPTVNQVIMLRQTQSSIVFVQQLGRGLRKAATKEYLVVIDFIGNYANNFMIPIALFGDQSLNKESLRKNLIAAEESGVLPGLSSIRFDRVAQERVLSSLAAVQLDRISELRTALLAMRYRVGRRPALWDFHRFESVSPVVLATKRLHYPALLQAALKEPHGLSPDEELALQLLSHEVLAAKRLHELVLVDLLLSEVHLGLDQIAQAFARQGLSSTPRDVGSAVDTLTLETFSQVDSKRYQRGVAQRTADGAVELTDDFMASYTAGARFTEEVDDLVRTGKHLVLDNYDLSEPFTVGRQYTRKDATRLLGWPRSWTSTIYGYRADVDSGSCPVFVTLHKSTDIAASTAYEDRLLDASTLEWFSKSKRTLRSPDVAAIVSGAVAVHVFLKKDDAEGDAFYYVGRGEPRDAHETTMPDDSGAALSVVRMQLRFTEPIQTALFDYLHPVVTE